MWGPSAGRKIVVMSHLRDIARFRAIAVLAWATFLGGASRAQGPPAPPGATERLETRDGRRLAGRLVRDGAGRLVFRSDPGEDATPEASFRAWTIEGDESRAPGPVPPFQVRLAPWGRISGRLIAAGSDEVRLDSDAIGGEVTISRAGVAAIVQRPGEVQVLRDDFEKIDPARWSQGGTPDLATDPHRSGAHALRLPAGGASLTTRLPMTVPSGRLELEYFEDGARVAGQRWYVDLSFRKPNSELSTVRVVLGWAEETLAVETPGGPSLNVQLLRRRPGWRRLLVKFDDRRAALSIDGDDLAHGPGLGGPLSEIRIASEIQGAGRVPGGLAAIFDDLNLVRFAEPSGQFEVDPSQDEIRLITGDQIFGRFRGANADVSTMAIEGRDFDFSWSEVFGVYFRRVAETAKGIEGQWVRAEWQATPGDDPRDLDQIEAVLVGLDDTGATLEAPYVGRVTIPRDRLRRLEFLSTCRRIVIDPAAHHLGDRMVEDLDPPQPESSPYGSEFVLEEVPTGSVVLALDVIQVIGEEGTLRYSDLVRKGEFRTKLALNGRALDDLNLYVPARNETVARVRVPVPPNVLVAGKNSLTITQTGGAAEPAQRDNLGLLGIALEFTPERAAQP